MPDPTEIAAPLLAHRRGEQDRSPRFHPRPDERSADRDERSQAACVVGDAGTLEPRPAPRHGNIEFRTKNGVQMRAQDNASVMWGRDTSCPYRPTTHVSYIVDRDVFQTNVPQH